MVSKLSYSEMWNILAKSRAPMRSAWCGGSAGARIYELLLRTWLNAVIQLGAP